MTARRDRLEPKTDQSDGPPVAWVVCRRCPSVAVELWSWRGGWIAVAVYDEPGAARRVYQARKEAGELMRILALPARYTTRAGDLIPRTIADTYRHRGR